MLLACLPAASVVAVVGVQVGALQAVQGMVLSREALPTCRAYSTACCDNSNSQLHLSDTKWTHLGTVITSKMFGTVINLTQEPLGSRVTAYAVAVLRQCK